MQFPSLAFLQGYTAIGADYPVPGEIVFFGKGVEHSHGITGAVGKPRFEGNIPVAGNFTPGNGENVFYNPAGGIGHSGILLCILRHLSSYTVTGNNTHMGTANIDPALIRKSELFSSLRQDEIDFVISYSDTLNLPKKELLFSSGEKASHFYILISGEIHVYKQNSDGSEESMARFTPGDIIGEFDFVRGAEYDADAEATKNSHLIVFPGFGLTIDSLAQKIPHMVCGIQLNALIMMTGRIKSIRNLILENMSWVKELHRRAYEDPGTGLWKQVLINDDIKNVLNDPAALILLKPDRFKILVDSRGHSAGDEAMIRIAAILKNFCRRFGQGWPLRFKSNEVGIIINNCDFVSAEKAAAELANSIAALEPFPAQGAIPEFTFSVTVAWARWANDDPEWDSLLQGTYTALLAAWHAGGEKIVHYSKEKAS